MTHDSEPKPRVTVLPAPSDPAAGVPAASVRVTDTPAAERTLVDHARVVYAERLTVIAVLAAVVALGIAYILVATPVYRSVALVQIEDKNNAVVGVSDLLGEKIPAEAEIEIIRSRSAVGSVVDQLGLDRTARPRTFPFVGNAILRLRAKAAERPWFAFGPFAWGGERIRLERLTVSDDLVGQRLVITALGGGRLRIADRDGHAFGEGRVDQDLHAEHDGSAVDVFVSELVGAPGTQFFVRHLGRERAIDSLQQELRVAERGKKTGIVALEYEAADPARARAVVEALANAYVRQNVERKSAEAAKTLEFVEEQLPIIKGSLDSAEGRLNSYQVKRGTVSLSLETQTLLQRSVETEKALSDIDMQRAELRQRFSENHPLVTSLNEKAARLRAQREGIEQRLRSLPGTELDSARLSRDVKVANELYSLLLNRAQELRIVKSGTIGNVRIVDHAMMPYQPVRPQRKIILALALFAGAVGGVAAAYVRSMTRTRLDDPAEVERLTGLPVYAVIPHSRAQSAMHRPRAGDGPAIVCAANPGDPVAESFRSLRTSLQFALVEARTRVVVVSGPTPEVGKSFVSSNLAAVLAAADYRVVLVDADLRRGALHHVFGTERSPGLSDVFRDGVALDRAIQHTDQPGLDFLSAGRIPPNPSELLNSRRFMQTIDELSSRYDLVIVDTPPILAVSDMALIARTASVNLVVLRHGRHTVGDVTHALRMLTRHGVQVNGAVLNDVVLTRGRYGTYGRYSSFEYHSR